MSLYNVEIFQPDFTYRDSFQTADMTYEFDYLSLSNNKLKLIKIKAERGDYIRISSGKLRICGIVEGVEGSDTSVTISYKSILSIFDVNIYADISIVLAEECAIEDWIADIIKNTYVSNEDILQNVFGMEVKTTSSTTGNKRLSLEGNINNVYDILNNALMKHGIIVSADIDVQKKKIIITVGKNDSAEKYIEADLPNVLKKSFTIKKSDESLNKLIMINEDDETEQKSYYLLTDGTISTESDNTSRITPVVFDTKYVSVQKDETFDDVAYQKALDELIPEEYDNLIELTVESDDCLVSPDTMTVGQKAVIKHKGVEYKTILTGIEQKDKVKLMFGAVRLELTKKLKRRNK